MHTLRHLQSLLLPALTLLNTVTSLPTTASESLSLIQSNSLVANTSLPFEVPDPGIGPASDDTIPFRSRYFPQPPIPPISTPPNDPPRSILDSRLHYRELIETTDLTLLWDYTTFLTNKPRISALLSNTTALIDTQINRYGSSAKLPVAENTTGRQYFESRINNGLELEVVNVEPYTATWGDLKMLMVALEAKCGAQLCTFEFQIGKGPRIGKGRLGKVKK